MFLEKHLFLLTILLLNAFIVESRKHEFDRARDKKKITRRHLFRHRDDLEHGGWRNDSSNATITCHRNNAMMISGSLLKLSDIPPKPDRKCNGIEAKIIELFATEKVILDEDFIESGEESTFVIIAPTWEVIGSRKIILDGSPGAEHHPTRAENGSPQGGYDGANGIPGLPGGRGGNFYGIGETFINAEKLFISTNGGNGGPGQDGGDGADGIDAHSTFHFEGSLDELEDPQYRVDITLNDFDPLGTTTTHYVVHGPNGTVGGKGGDGGCGGKGGFHGHIVILNLDGTENGYVYGSAKDGLDGPGGEGGKGGKGGSNARSVKFTQQTIHSWTFFSSAKEVDDGFAPDGKNGWANENRLGLRLLNDFYPSLSIQSAASDFKFFAMWYLLDSADDATFRDFYSSLLNVTNIRNWNSISGFQVEASYIEELYIYSKKRDLLLPFVESLKQRIDAFLKVSEVFVYAPMKKYILQNLLLRLSNINRVELVASDFVNHLVVDFKLPDLNDVIHKFDYYEKLEQQIKLVKNNFRKISSILNEGNEEKIDKYKTYLDEKIDRLMTESLSSKDTIERRVELNDELHNRFALETIRSANLALQFANIKVFIDSMLTLNYERRFRLFSETDFAQFIFPRNVQETYEEIQIKYKNYISKRVAIIESHQAFVKKRKHFETDLLSNQLEMLCMELKSSKLIGSDSFGMEADILLRMEERLIYLEGGSIKDRLLIQVMNHLKLHSILGEIFGDSYERFTSDKWTLGTKRIFVDFRKNYEYNKLHQARENISTEVFSKFDNNWIRVEIVDDKLGGSEEIDFVVLKRNFDTLNTTFYYGNNVSTINFINFTFPIEYLKQMMQYQLPAANFVPSSYETTLLECYKQYNDLKDYYFEFVTQYRQYAFPTGTKDFEYFAQHLEKETISEKDWKDVLKSINIFDTSLDTAPKEKIKSLYKRMQTFIDFSSRNINEIKLFNDFRVDQYMNCYKDNAECPSLFTWQNEMHKKEIADLFSGEEVTLESVIGPDNLQGVKFGQVVGIEFRSDNKSLEEELALILKENFKVVLTHHGNSHYKCEQDVYVIVSKKYSFTFYFDGFSVWINRHYEQFLLSPYATWTMQLKGKQHNINLNKYKDFVDVSLIGEVYYLNDDKSRKYCNDDLQRYYRKEGAPVEPEFVRNLIKI